MKIKKTALKKIIAEEYARKRVRDMLQEGMFDFDQSPVLNMAKGAYNWLRMRDAIKVEVKENTRGKDYNLKIEFTIKNSGISARHSSSFPHFLYRAELNLKQLKNGDTRVTHVGDVPIVMGLKGPDAQVNFARRTGEYGFGGPFGTKGLKKSEDIQFQSPAFFYSEMVPNEDGRNKRVYGDRPVTKESVKSITDQILKKLYYFYGGKNRRLLGDDTPTWSWNITGDLS